jgi:hypothetical protein
VSAAGVFGLQPAVFLAAGSRVSALNAATGAILWSRTLAETSLFGPPVVSTAGLNGSILYVGGASGQVYALYSNTGADAPGGLTEKLASVTGTLALVGNYLYVPTAAGLVGVDVRTGARFWSHPLSAASGVAVAGGVPYVATSDSRFVGFSATPSPPPVTVVHDLAIESIQVASQVSRSRSAEVQVTLVNRGTETENYNLLVRVQPGRILLHDSRGSLVAGQKKVVSFLWSPLQMGDDGPKSLVAQVELQGQEDRSPADNNALQVVTVGP